MTELHPTYFWWSSYFSLSQFTYNKCNYYDVGKGKLVNQIIFSIHDNLAPLFEY